jgi:hypothetical protein
MIAAMRKLILRYRKYLARKAAASGPGYNRVIDMQWHWLPWISLWLITAGVCDLFSLQGASSLIAIVPLMGLSVTGMVLVLVIFLRSSLRDLPEIGEIESPAPTDHHLSTPDNPPHPR